jgi:hypothetical protein
VKKGGVYQHGNAQKEFSVGSGISLAKPSRENCGAEKGIYAP